MKKTITLCLLVAVATGCAYTQLKEHTYNPETQTYDDTFFSQTAFFNKQATKGLVIGKRTKTGSTSLSLAEGSTETQADALRAVAEGAAAGAVKGARP